MEVINYPYKKDADSGIVVRGINNKINQVVSSFDLGGPIQERTLAASLKNHYQEARAPFEEIDREIESGEPQATNLYHRTCHTVDQVGYDVLAVLEYAKTHLTPINRHLSPEFLMATFIAAIKHDSGYAESNNYQNNYAERKSTHVAEGVLLGTRAVDRLGVPGFIDKNLVRDLVPIGIQATYFPFKNEHKSEQEYMISQLGPKKRDLGIAVAEVVWFVDFGGQIARVDYLDTIWDLEREENYICEGQGTDLVGADDKKLEKLKGFIGGFAEPILSRPGELVFGTTEHPFAFAWRRHLANSNLSQLRLAS